MLYSLHLSLNFHTNFVRQNGDLHKVSSSGELKVLDAPKQMENNAHAEQDNSNVWITKSLSALVGHFIHSFHNKHETKCYFGDISVLQFIIVCAS